MRSYVRRLATLVAPQVLDNTTGGYIFGGAPYDTVANIGNFATPIPGSPYGFRVRPLGGFSGINFLLGGLNQPILSLALSPGLPLKFSIIQGSAPEAIVHGTGWNICESSTLQLIPSVDRKMAAGCGIVGDYVIDVADSEEELFMNSSAAGNLKTSFFLAYSPGGSFGTAAPVAAYTDPTLARIYPHYLSTRFTTNCSTAGTITKWFYDLSVGSWAIGGTFSYPTASAWMSYDEDVIAGSDGGGGTPVYYQLPGAGASSFIFATMPVIF